MNSNQPQTTYQNMSLKPLYSAGSVFLLDRYMLGNKNTMQSVYLGAAGGIGSYAASMISPFIPLEKVLPSINGFVKATTLENRILEISLTAGLGYTGNRFIFKNDSFSSDMAKKIGIIALGEVIGTYVDQYLHGSALNYLN